MADRGSQMSERSGDPALAGADIRWRMTDGGSPIVNKIDFALGFFGGEPTRQRFRQSQAEK